uniref:Beta-hexosaminidase n=1 Tax=Hirondellea gigas TaxID=1518452 RepID=A0A6A7G8F4_9CRUS
MVVPKPQKTAKRNGSFVISANTEIVLNSNAREDDGIMNCVHALQTTFQRLSSNEITLQISDSSKVLGSIFLEISDDLKNESPTKNESYILDVSTDRISICAPKSAGLFYGIQTLRQLVNVDRTRRKSHRLTVNCTQIQDEPRFEWRGLMLDVSRHFFSVNEVKKFLDTMSLFKLNRFHWHLVDDQGWRIEILRYPELTSIGAYRRGSPKPGHRTETQLVPYFGYYTQADIREVVAYAEERFITVVPEIELPGHCQEVVAAYVDLGNTDIPDFEIPEVRMQYGISPYTLNPSTQSLDFLRNVFVEVLDLFPNSPFIHIGGDEAPTTQWAQSPFAQSEMIRLGFQTARELQGYFTSTIGEFLGDNGRTLIGWNEILEGRGLPDSAAVMVWNNAQAAIEAVEAGHRVVMAPTTHTYFDYPQSLLPTEPETIAGRLLELETVYSFDPVPPGLSEEEEKLIIGTQGQLWSEYFWESYQMEYNAFPRAIALAEVAWTTDKPSYDDFLARLEPELETLKSLNVNFRPLSNDNPSKSS